MRWNFQKIEFSQNYHSKKFKNEKNFHNQVHEGGYFGELALVNHDKRAATVVAKDDVKVACESQWG